ncbi:MAG TPA: HigA family addiction module antitoxin [Armatimonadota bacterium]|nr:HigA family addiction module antitoxin [Armatimonadota bacterium]
MIERKVAEVFPPGVFIKEELDARGWSQVELAEIIGRSPVEVNALVLGKRAVTPEMAKELGDAFGTDAQYWMNLESTYQLHRTKDADNAISRRAKLHQIAPIREMVKRHWLEMSENIDVLEHRVKRFFGISDLEKPIPFLHAARRGTQEITPTLIAWFYRAKQLACAVHAKPFSERSFKSGLNELKTLLPNTQDVRHIPRILAEAGIRFLVVEHLPKTRIDGVAFWLDEKSPVIVLSLRYDRIDWFWFTLAHELGHVGRRDGLRNTPMTFDTDLVGDEVMPEEQESESEREASRFATEFLINQSELRSFIARVSPLYSRTKIIGFASTIGVHPGIVVGQLQHRKEIGWAVHRQMLDKVRNTIIQSALTDGWGHTTPILS